MKPNCSISEIEDCLKANLTYSQITAKTGASPNTISKVKKSIQSKMDTLNMDNFYPNHNTVKVPDLQPNVKGRSGTTAESSSGESAESPHQKGDSACFQSNRLFDECESAKNQSPNEVVTVGNTSPELPLIRPRVKLTFNELLWVSQAVKRACRGRNYKFQLETSEKIIAILKGYI